MQIDESIEFVSNFDQRDYKVFELPPSILQSLQSTQSPT